MSMTNFEAGPFSEGVWITPSGSDPVLQGGSSVAVLFFVVCSCVGGSMCGICLAICLAIVCSSSLLLLGPREGHASWLWHILGIFTYIVTPKPKRHHSPAGTQRWTTSIQRWFNVLTLNQRWIDVVLMSCACWEVSTLSKSVELFGSCRGVLRSSYPV